MSGPDEEEDTMTDDSAPRSGDQEQLLVTVPAEDLDEVRRVAAENGVEIEPVDELGFDPVTGATLLLLGGALAVATVSHVIERLKGGQVIDLRPEAARPFYRTKDVLYGLVVVRRADGTISVEVTEPKELFGVVVDALKGIVVELGKASIDVAGQAVEAAVGEKGTVTVSPGSTDAVGST